MKSIKLCMLCSMTLACLGAMAQSPEPGYSIASLSGSSGYGPVAVKSATEIFAVVPNGSWTAPAFNIVIYNPESGVSTNYVTGATDDDGNHVYEGGVSGYIGGIYYDASSDALYFTENYSFDTLFVAQDLDDDGAATGEVDLGGGSFAGEVRRVAPDGSLPYAADVQAGTSTEMLVLDAVGGGLGRILAVDTVGGATRIVATGFDYNGGLARHPITGEVYAGNSSFPFPGSIYRLLGDSDSSGAIEIANPLEADLIASVTGPGNFCFDAEGTLLVSTADKSVLRIFDSNSDNVPETLETIATGFAYSGGMAFFPASLTLRPFEAGGTLYVCDPWDWLDSNIKSITGDPFAIQNWLEY